MGPVGAGRDGTAGDGPGETLVVRGKEGGWSGMGWTWETLQGATVYQNVFRPTEDVGGEGETPTYGAERDGSVAPRKREGPWHHGGGRVCGTTTEGGPETPR